MKDQQKERLRSTLQPPRVYKNPHSSHLMPYYFERTPKNFHKKQDSNLQKVEKQNIYFKNKVQGQNFQKKNQIRKSNINLSKNSKIYGVSIQTPIKYSQIKQPQLDKRKTLDNCCRSTFVQNFSSQNDSSSLSILHENQSIQKSRKTLHRRSKSNTPAFLKKIMENKKQKQLKINDFILLKKLGNGKYGCVSLAIDKKTGFVCAIKIINKSLIKDEDISNTLVQEFKIQLYLNHPNIVKAYGCFQDDKNVYLMLEYCPDGNLETIIKKTDEFSQQDLLPIITNIFQSVFYLHCQGIIHRDLKPENIVISNGTYKLCDFGWAVYTSGQNRLTFCGTPLYVSPQVLKGNGYNQKVDIWGLGILCYELIFGRVPFKMSSPKDMVKIMHDEIIFPQFTEQISQQFVKMVKQMLKRDCDERLSINEILDHCFVKQFIQKQQQQLSLRF